MNDKINRATKGLSFLRNLNSLYYLVIIYELIIRPHLDYLDIAFDRPSNAVLSSRIESVRCSAARIITETIKGFALGKLYQELKFSISIKDVGRDTCVCFIRFLN